MHEKIDAKYYAIYSLFRPPNIFDVRDAALRFLNRHHRAEFKYFDVLRLYRRLQRGKINRPCARRAVVASRKLHVMDVKAEQLVALRFQMERVIDEPQVFFDLRV